MKIEFTHLKTVAPLSTHHSSLGAYLFIVKHFDEARTQVEPSYNPIAMLAILMFSYPIFKHHGKYLGDDYKDKISFTADEVACMKAYVANYKYQIPNQLTDLMPLNLKSAFEKLDNTPNLSKSFSLYSLVRLNFSLLTASDYLASSQYMTGIEIKEFGILSLERINDFFDFVSTSNTLLNGKENYNKATYQRLESGYELQNPKVQDNDNLNVLRQEMALEVIRNIRANSHKNLFYIEAPTGGGKTNLSMLATIELFAHM